MTKVLIFETDHAFAVELRTEFTQLGCTVQVFKEGATGLIAAAHNRPDLVLLSVELPRMNGYSVCNKIKKDPSLSSVPIVIMSSTSSPETFEQHQRLRTRADDYIHKPIAIGALLERIQRIVPIGIVDPQATDPVSHDIIIDDSELIPIDETPLHSHGQPATADPVTVEMDAEAVRAAVAAPTSNRAARRRDLESPAGLQPPPGLQPMAAGAGPPAGAHDAGFALPGLGEEDEDEDTRVGPRSGQLAAAGGIQVPTQAQAPRVGILPDARRVDSSAETRIDQLEHALALANSELAQTRSAVQEAPRLRKELDAVAKRLSSATEGTASSGREVLVLREQLQEKSRENLQLRDEISAKDRELLEVRDQSLAAGRGVAEVQAKLTESEKQLSQLEQQLSEAQARAEQLVADKALSDNRAADFRAGAKKIADQLNQRSSELRDERDNHATEVQALERAHEDALTEADEKFRDVLSETEQGHQNELEKAATERTSFVEGLTQKQTAELAKVAAARDAAKTAADEAQTTALSELESANQEHEAQSAQQREVHENTLRAQLEKHAEATEALKKEREAATEALKKERKAATEALKKEHEAATETLKKELEAAHAEAQEARLAGEERQKGVVAELEAAHANAIEKLSSDNAEALQKASDDLQENLLQNEASFKSIKEQLDQDLAEARAAEQGVLATLKATQESEVALEEQATTLMSERDELREESKRLGESAEQDRARLEKARQRWGEDRQALDHAKDALSQVVSHLAHAAKQKIED